MDIRPQFSLSQLSRLDVPTLHIIYDDIKLIHSVQPKLTERGKYIADILRFAVRVSSLELNRLPTDDLKYISNSFCNLNKELTEWKNKYLTLSQERITCDLLTDDIDGGNDNDEPGSVDKTGISKHGISLWIKHRLADSIICSCIQLHIWY